MHILMFVPGHKPEFIKKAQGLKKKYKELILVYDLEDSVPQDQKKQALENVNKAATSYDWVRIDASTSCYSIYNCENIIIPKATPRKMEFYNNERFIPLIETAEGVEYARKLVKNAPAVIFGQYDLAVSMKSDLYTDYASSRIVGACKAFGTPVYNSPNYSLDRNKIAEHAKRSYELGYDGVCILHPDHIETVKEHFGPYADENEWAKTILDNSKDGISVTYNTIIGPPVLERARQILE